MKPREIIFQGKFRNLADSAAKGRLTMSKSRKEKVKIYKPKNEVEPVFKTNVIVDNFTDDNGRVYNRSEENILLSKKEVDENHK